MSNIKLYTEGDFVYGTATDGYNYMVVQFDSRIIEPGECLLDPNLLELQGDVLEIEGQDEQIKVTTDGAELTHNTMLVTQFPILKPTNETFGDAIDNLNVYINKALKALGKEKQGKQYTYMSLVLDKETVLTAADPCNIYQVVLPVTFPRRRVIVLDALPAKLLASKLFSGFRIAIDSLAHFDAGDVRISVVKEGNALKIPPQGIGTSLFVKPDKVLVNTLKAAAKVADVVQLSTTGNQLTVTASSPSAKFTNSVNVERIDADFSLYVNALDLLKGISLVGLSDFTLYEVTGNGAIRVGNDLEGYYTILYEV